jgi:hypothetical protein
MHKQRGVAEKLYTFWEKAGSIRGWAPGYAECGSSWLTQVALVKCLFHRHNL